MRKIDRDTLNEKDAKRKDAVNEATKQYYHQNKKLISIKNFKKKLEKETDPTKRALYVAKIALYSL